VSTTAVTQCPHCKAKFRVRYEHVSAHGGLVRCGACRGVFDARQNLIEGRLADPEDDTDTFGGPRTIVGGMPSVAQTPTEEEFKSAAQAAIAPKREPATTGLSQAHRQRAIGIDTRTTSEGSVASNPTATTNDADDTRDADYDWRKPSKPMSRGTRLMYALLSLFTLIALLAQSAYWFRDEIANRMPSTAPYLAQGCAALGCRVSPPRQPDALGFVGAELAADPAHKGLLVFTATLRNASPRSVAFPSLVLTLDGVGNEPIARRIFSPEQYAPASASLARGLDGGAEMEIKLYLDASPATPVGFKADHAYF
jgi:predicted Zn finger-like uncharacterized protein